MTAVLLDLDARRAVLRPGPVDTAPLNLCDRPTVSALCASLTRRGRDEETCGGLLAYQGGRWQHVNAGPGSPWCPEAQPATCQHPTCNQTADVYQVCAAGPDLCCGCCWAHDDVLEGRQLWPTS